MSKRRFCNTSLRIKSALSSYKDSAQRNGDKLEPIMLNLHPAFFFSLGTCHCIEKRKKGQLDYEFHQKALKHISHGVTLSNLPCWVKYRSLQRQQVLVLLAEMQEVIYRDSIADRIFFVHFFLWHSDKVICISNWKQLPSFWCNIVSVNDTLKRRWKGKELQENEKKIDWNYTSLTGCAVRSMLHHQNGLQHWAGKKNEPQLCLVLYCVT